MHVSELATPALLVDRAVLTANLAAADDLLAGTGKLIRPHVKTHRTPALALLQQTAHARGVTCATVGEAEVMADAGISDILIANEVVSPAKIERIVELASRASVLVAVDAAEPVRTLSQAAARAGVTLGVLVDLDVGLQRCGVRSAEAARDLAHVVSEAAGLRFAGVMGYEGRLRRSTPERAGKAEGAFDLLREAKGVIEGSGLEVPVVSGAGTSTLTEALRSSCLSEVQAGTYALMERDLEGLGLPFRCAVSILATVISRSANRVVVDLGRKTVGCEYGLPAPLGGAVSIAISEEHTVIEYVGETPRIGELIRLLPSQVRTTFNLHDVAWLIQDDEVCERLDVTARGRSQ